MSAEIRCFNLRIATTPVAGAPNVRRRIWTGYGAIRIQVVVIGPPVPAGLPAVVQGRRIMWRSRSTGVSGVRANGPGLPVAQTHTRGGSRCWRGRGDWGRSRRRVFAGAGCGVCIDHIANRQSHLWHHQDPAQKNHFLNCSFHIFLISYGQKFS